MLNSPTHAVASQTHPRIPLPPIPATCTPYCTYALAEPDLEAPSGPREA